MVLKNLKPRPVELQVWMNGVLYPVIVDKGGWYDVPEDGYVKNIAMLKASKDVAVLRIPEIRGLRKFSDI